MVEQKVQLEDILIKVGDLGLRRRVKILLSYLDVTDRDRVLDCGCGEGFYSMVLAELTNAQITAFDYNTELLEKASKWTAQKKNVAFINGDITKGLPFEEGTFDKIIFTEVMEHLEDDLGALKELRRVLKKGGTIGLTVPNRNYPFFWDPLNWSREHLGLGHFNPRNTILGGVWSYDHKRLYSPDKIKRLAEDAGFKVLKIEALTHYCFPFNYHILRLGKLFYTKFPVSLKVKESMEKFEWRRENGNNDRFSLIKVIFNIFKWIDSQNDKYHHDIDKSSVSISLKLEK
jgi:SAM-dependent methyltransferase